MLKAVATTLTALMLTAFAVRDREAGAQTLVMIAILWIAAAYLWWRLAREWRLARDQGDRGRGHDGR